MLTCCGVHLIGSVPLSNSESVFDVLCRELGSWLKRIPDGETGVRGQWIRWQHEMLLHHPAMEVDPSIPPQEFRLRDGRLLRTSALLRLRPAIDPAHVTFETGYEEAAKNSYTVFKTLRDEGRIPSGIRFQVCLPTPMATAYMDISPSSRHAFLSVYERALLRALQEIVQVIPARDLAIQWDVCQEVLLFEGYFADRPTTYRNDVAAELGRMGNAVPADVECGYHLCYGSPHDEHLVMPKDMSVLVEIAEGIIAHLRRQLNFIHLPVPRARTDDAYFAPMRGFHLPAGTELYLGVIAEDERQGDLARVAAAAKVVRNFGVATECGWGRKSAKHVAGLLAAHKALMQPAGR